MARPKTQKTVEATAPKGTGAPADPALTDYWDKREPNTTNEPFAGETEQAAHDAQASAHAFVIHLHDASRLHCDLRLEHDGSLMSFAVPRGIPERPEDKHLAVHTENHPLEYLDFEAHIPDGNYGAGPMIVWDRGLVHFLAPGAKDGIKLGKLDLELRGYRVRGRFALVRIKAGNGNEWLLLRKKNAAARPLVPTEARSVLTGLRLADLSRRDTLGATWEAAARAHGAEPAQEPSFRVAAPERGPQPRRDDLLFDCVLGGVRVLAIKTDDAVELRQHDGAHDRGDIAEYYPELVHALRLFPSPRLCFEGEIVAGEGTSSEHMPRLLGERLRALANAEGTSHIAYSHPVQLVVSDLLGLGALDTRGVPLRARRELLAEMLPDEPALLRCATPLPLGSLAPEDVRRAAQVPAVRLLTPEGVYGQGVVEVVAAQHAPVTVDHQRANVARQVVRLTNQHKELWPTTEHAPAFRKADLLAYYTAVAPQLLPYLAQRPIIVVRYPDGIAGKNFYQWNVPAHAPSWLRTVRIPSDDDHQERRGFLVEDVPTLSYLANLACIPIHVLGSRVGSLDQADFLTVDFDVKQSSLAAAIPMAQALGEWLEQAGLPGFAKTSGQTGLHVLVGLGAGHSFETARLLCDLLGRMLVARFPSDATMERRIEKRGAKVLVDTGQTGRTRAIVAPYSLRATPRALVSTPLSWNEVSENLDPTAFDIRSVPARLRSQGDPMAMLLRSEVDMERALGKLTELGLG
jgi:bifunctional non-homologous end joining protein LigD